MTATMTLPAAAPGPGRPAPTLGQRLLDRLDRDPGWSCAVVGRDEADTAVADLPALVADARRAATALAAAGVGPGGRVVLALETSPAFVQAFWACQLLGAVAVPSFPASVGPAQGRGSERLRAIVAASAPAAVVATRDPGPDVTAGVPAVDVARAVATGAEPYDGPVPDDPDAPAIVQFTSGSTARPRGCVLTHRAVGAGVEAIGEGLATVPGDVVVSWLPLFHDMGLIGGVVAPLCLGVHSVLQPTTRFVRDPLSWLRAVDRWRGTISMAPNFGFALVNRRLRHGPPDVDLSSLRVIVNGAEPVAPAVVREFVAGLAPVGLGPDVVSPAYGLAEATLLVSIERGLRTDRVDADALTSAGEARPAGGDRGREIVSLGRPTTGSQARVVGPDGTPRPERTVGRVEVRCASTMTGYLDDEAATRAVLSPDGWLRTGDVGYLAGGRVHLLGREDDMIILGGRNVAPQDVERLAESVAGVRPGAAAAIGVPGRRGTEDLVVVVEARSADAERLRVEVARACADGLDVVPRRVVVVRRGELPRTTSGKVQRSVVRARQAAAAVDAGRDDPGERP